MKKVFLFILFFQWRMFVSAQEPNDNFPSSSVYNVEQQTMINFAATYYRSNPYNRLFSEFMNHLLNDPTITQREVEKRTDSSLFYFKGEYTKHNPFFYPAIRTEIILSETAISYDDSTGKIDTIITYQLSGYSSANKEGEAAVKEEYIKFQKKWKRKFWAADPVDLQSGNIKNGQMQNYFLGTYPISPLTIAWGRVDEHSEYVFVITLRMKVINNIASLP